MFINQPSVTLKWAPSKIFLKVIWKQLQIAASAGKTSWEASFKENQILELKKQFYNHDSNFGTFLISANRGIFFSKKTLIVRRCSMEWLS